MVQLTTQWGYLKNKVFATPPQNIKEPRQRIIDEFNGFRQASSLKWFVMQYATCTNEQLLVSNEMGGHIKGHGP